MREVECGFRIGFRYESCCCASVQWNILSAAQHPEPIEAYLAKEVRLGRILGPLPGGRASQSFGVIPKSHQPGKWRLITDSFSPQGASVNDGIDPSLCTLTYSTVNEAVRCILRLGHDAELAKFDIKRKYRLVPLYPQDRLLLGMAWIACCWARDGLRGWSPSVRAVVSAQSVHGVSRCSPVVSGQ